MDVDALLAARQSQYKSIEVEKEVELQYDLGNLLATDLNALDTDTLKKQREKYLKDLMRDNTQLLFNKIWELPTEKTEGLVLAELPTPTTVLPREKPIPKPKPPTKWEIFAKTKSIQKRKRPKMVFDEKAQEWKPRWGYKRINDPKEEWLIEVRQNANPKYADQFEQKSEERRERVAKNEYQRLRNIGRTQKGKFRVPLPPSQTKDLGKHEITQALGLAKSATASMGKFTPALPKEPVPKRGKKRKFDPVVGDSATEKQKNLDILTKISKQKEVLNVKKAVNMHIAEEEKRKHLQRKSGDGEGKAKRRKTGGKPKRSGGGGIAGRKGGGGSIAGRKGGGGSIAGGKKGLQGGRRKKK